MLAVLLLLLIGAGEMLVVRALANRATVHTVWAGLQQRDWSTSDAMWRQLFQWPPARGLALRGMAQLHQHWHRFEAVDAHELRELFNGDVPLVGASTALAYLGDHFRAARRIKTAEELYKGALLQADFLNPEEEAQTQYKLSLIQQQAGAELVQNGRFENGLQTWGSRGQGVKIEPGSGVHLTCQSCSVTQSVPLFGGDAYRLIIVAKSGVTDANAGILVTLTIDEDVVWTHKQLWQVTPSWQQEMIPVWIPVLNATTARMEITAATETPVVIARVSFQLANDPRNYLRNAGFEAYEPAADIGTIHFPGWVAATLWNERQAEGRRRLVAGARSPAALEIELTAAELPQDRLGLEQLCGEFSPGSTVTLVGDLFLPADLQGAYADVLVYLYQPHDLNDLLVLQLLRREATSGWLHMESNAILPQRPHPYRCSLLVEIVAERPLQAVQNVARFDNLLLMVQSEQNRH